MPRLGSLSTSGLLTYRLLGPSECLVDLLHVLGFDLEEGGLLILGVGRESVLAHKGVARERRKRRVGAMLPQFLDVGRHVNYVVVRTAA